MKSTIKVALLGNPNVGKTSVFNALTGLKQRVGNYPGITVERKIGTCSLGNGIVAEIVDLPGTYSINATSKDEEIALSVLFDATHKEYPDVVVVVAEVENLKRNLLLFSQIKDLGFPMILAINMADRMERQGIAVDIEKLEDNLDAKIILLSARRHSGIEELKQAINNYTTLSTKPFFDITKLDTSYFNTLTTTPGQNLYRKWLIHVQQGKGNGEEIKKIQHTESVKRYRHIQEKIQAAYTIDRSKATGLRFKMDRILTHKVFGYLIFFAIMLLVFQAIFDWASVPMDFIDEQFAGFSKWTKTNLPAGKLTELLSDGIIPGVGGVVIFIPQIAILFLFIAVLEESGYMSRVVFLMDRVMRPFGLSGKSVVPLISGVACAIPAIMSARNIEDSKERLITMLVTPFATCSARIPVYVIIISLVIPDTKVIGFIGLQGLVMTLMYLAGFGMALFAAWVMKYILKSDRKTFFIIEMPSYKVPLLKNVLYTVIEKTKAFVLGAGKIILALSVILWFLGSHGPTDTYGKAEIHITEKHKYDGLTEKELDDEIAGYQLETSYIGMLGSVVEPVFKPLGYDWKISIAVLTSFAAREVFVGNLATLYNIGSQGEDVDTVVNRMKKEKRPDGTPTFNLATGVSLLVFYAFAMQCISTLGVTKRETNSWKWMFIQMTFMSVIAYLLAFIAYQTLA